MGIRVKQLSNDRQRVARPPRPATRDYVGELQRRAGKLSQDNENQAHEHNGADAAEHQRRHIERQMAQLRSEAVQARRLAEHIDNLSQDATKRRRNRAMSDSLIVDPGHAQRMNRRSSDAQRAGGSQLSFNPLHPSMELPPEQLIRLLGMEGKKKNRTRRKPHRRPERPTAEKRDSRTKAQPPAATTPAETTPEPLTAAQPARRREHAPVAGLDDGRRGWLIPSLVVGALLGAGLSAYLFWYQPSPLPDKAAAPTAKVSHSAKKSPPATAPAARPLPAKAKAPAAPEKPVVAAVAAPEKTPRISDSAEGRAAISAELRRLRSEAEQRLAQELIRLEAARELEQPTVANDGEIIAVTPPPGLTPPQTEAGPATAEPLTGPAEAGGDIQPVEPPQAPATAAEATSPLADNPPAAAANQMTDTGTTVEPPSETTIAPPQAPATRSSESEEATGLF